MSVSTPVSARASRARGTAARLAARPQAWIGGGLLLLLAAGALAADGVSALLGTDPQAVDLLNRLQPPSPTHPLGTDELGRDVLTLMLFAGRVSLLVGLGGALLAALLGTAVGVLAGWKGGRIDAVLMRTTDAVLALPLLPLLILLAAVDLSKIGLGGLGPMESALRIVVIVALFGWPGTARIARAATLSVERQPFVLAARALGVPDRRILLRHVLPNIAGPVIVATTLAVGHVILAESVLSFLGLGIQPPLASWGTMLSRAQELMFDRPDLALWPGLCIFAAVLGANLFGDALADALDPRSGTDL